MFTKIEQTDQSILFQDEQEICMIQPVSDHVIRCVYTVLGEIKEPSELVVKTEEAKVSCKFRETGKEWVISTQCLKVHFSKEDGHISYFDNAGNLLLRENGREAEEKQVTLYDTDGKLPVIERVKTIDGERNFIKNLKAKPAGLASKARIHFALKPEEGIYGLGQGEEGILDYRYKDQYLYQHNMRIPMPFFISTEEYGMFVDCGSVMTWHGGKEDSYLFLDTVSQADTYFISGSSADEIIHRLRMLTGKAVMLPRWIFGYIQSKEMYHSAQELLDVVKEYRRRDIPLDCVVQDWKSWKPGHWGEKSLDPLRYGDVEERFREIHDLHAHIMVSMWPTAAEGTVDYQQFLDNGYLLNDCSTYNAFDEGARELYWKQVKEGLFSKGFDAWWCDSTEPFSGKDWCGKMKREPWERFEIVSSEHKSFLHPAQSNLYALEHAKGIYENQRKTTEQKRVVNLTRSGYAGSQKYGAILWSGDISATWKTMKAQIIEGIQMGLSGYPYWTLDIGGFFTVCKNWRHRGCDSNSNSNMLWFWHGDYEQGVDDDGYKELYTRWLQLGTFLPVFRSHGTDTPREIWNFGKPGNMFYDTIADFIRLRYRLMPYIYSMAWEVCHEDATIMRGLFFDFPEDKEACDVRDEFMFGRSLLVCPVTEPMYYEKGGIPIAETGKKRKCYLPKGCGWYDFWDGTYYEGGQYIDADAPIEKIPVFVREGTILPMTEQTVYADEMEGKMLKLRIYAGRDAVFRYYEDSGDGYGYERGEYAVTEFVYSEDEKMFSYKEREGSYPGIKELRFETEMIDREKKEA
ncbi:MAG TPA: glycoside hydrolase family 31 protein [Candidatus Mediterraneibacter norfolkensis]|nr:glycoside hydrolase family 31 protein [Candidatus Mediterraneibacter norfolkensis]